MKRAFFALALFSAGPAGAADFGALAVNADSLKNFSSAAPFPVPYAATAPRGGDRWYGNDSRQARMRFNAYLLYKVPAAYTGAVSQILADARQQERISELVDLQLQHMYGAFTTHPGFDENPGIPSGDYKVTLLGAEKVPNEPYAKISYAYDDIVVFASSLFQGGGATRINFVLPRDPVTIYKKGFATPNSRKNLCTDEHYNSEGDFWYFWNPYQEGCPIGGGDLVGVQTDLTPMPMTRNTYPDYARLYGDNGGGETLQVSYLVGVDENFQSGDLGKKTFSDAFAGLKAAGFQATVDEPRRKRLSFRFGNARAAVEMLLLDPNSAGFASEAVRALRSADVFVYDGHSGLGGYLSPDRLAADSGQALALPQNKYQIFVFQGCSTYAYYNSAFFRLKSSAADPKGTKNLDIMTTGIGAAFDVGAAVDVAFLKSVTMGERPSWQTIMDRVRAAEGQNSALSHINGDEDNPKNP
jgi:hypothetical protein